MSMRATIVRLAVLILSASAAAMEIQRFNSDKLDEGLLEPPSIAPLLEKFEALLNGSFYHSKFVPNFDDLYKLFTDRQNLRNSLRLENINLDAANQLEKTAEKEEGTNDGGVTSLQEKPGLIFYSEENPKLNEHFKDSGRLEAEKTTSPEIEAFIVFNEGQVKDDLLGEKSNPNQELDSQKEIEEKLNQMTSEEEKVFSKNVFGVDDSKLTVEPEHDGSSHQ